MVGFMKFFMIPEKATSQTAFNLQICHGAKEEPNSLVQEREKRRLRMMMKLLWQKPKKTIKIIQIHRSF
jgi:hypothetical protein